MKIKNAASIIVWIVLGVALILIGLLVVGLSLVPESYKTLGGVLLGVGAGVASSNVSRLLVLRYEKKHPDIFIQTRIEQQDERNQQIRWKAKGKAADIIQWFIIGLAFLMIFLDLPLWLILLTVGIYVLKTVLVGYYIGRLNKEM